MRTFYNVFRSKFDVWWSKAESKTLVMALGTIIGSALYFIPFFYEIKNPRNRLPLEEQALYEKENLYPIQVQKQRELEAKQKKSATSTATLPRQES